MVGLLAVPDRVATAAAPGRTLAITPPPARLLGGGWRFRLDPHDAGQRAGWWHGATDAGWKAVSLPHVFDHRPLPQLFRGTVGWYARSLVVPPAPAGFGWAVRFEQVRRVASVWLNGRLLGVHRDPYTPFDLALSGLRPGANSLVVRVDNRKGADPREGWWNWGGITRPVTLLARGPVVLSDLGLLSTLRCPPGGPCGPAAVTVDGWVTNRSSAPVTPQVAIGLSRPHSSSSATGSTTLSRLAPGATAHVHFSVPVRGPRELWTPSHPRLYDAVVRTTVGSTVAQSDRRAVGLRSVAVHNGMLYLNGRRIEVQGASIQEDLPGRGPALRPADLDTIVSELRAVHATATRAQYLLSAGLLDRLDRAGILVWSQAPIYHRDALLTTPAQRAEALATVRGTVLEARSHPSVITHSVANELSPEPDRVPSTRTFLLAAADLARGLDPTLPVSLDLLSYPGFPRERTYAKFDLLGINNYFGWYPGHADHSTANPADLAPFLRQTHARYPAQAMVMTEFGAEATLTGPARDKQTYAFQQDYLRRTLALVDALPFMNGALYWTLREFAVKPHWDGGARRPDSPHDSIHHKGLLSYAGVPKPAWYTAQQLFAHAALYRPSRPATRAPNPVLTIVAVLGLLGLLAVIGALLAVAVWSFLGLRADARADPWPAPRPLDLRGERRADTTYA
jgi:beta-glucuronidase